MARQIMCLGQLCSKWLPIFPCLLLLLGVNSAQLSVDFYTRSCPRALPIIQMAVHDAVSKDTRMGASLLRLHFHDCFVNGCDGSILLDDKAGFKGEKTAGANDKSVRGYEVIDSIKSQLEKTCPDVVSCADIVAVAARDSVVALGGPIWRVQLGRRDSKTASYSAANSDLPSPSFDLNDLIASFSKKGFTAKEMVALSGSHTIGHARCATFRRRILNDSDIDPTFAATVRSNCPSSNGDEKLSPLDAGSPESFDNLYFWNLASRRGLLHSDQQLFSGGSTDADVSNYRSNPAAFMRDFAAAMEKMSVLGVITGTAGEVRKDCRRVN